ncbi:MAG TPA: AMP-binding protein [Novosphingobium sp.]|nr:AMP-binding protein [Novosphingobium sp.]
MREALDAACWPDRLALRFGERLALADGARQVSYADLAARSAALAGALAARGLAAGDRVAALMLNGAPLIELYLAAARLGAIVLPLNWRLAPAELGWILGNAAPRLWFVSEGLADLAEAIAPGLDTVMVTDGAAGADGYDALLAEGHGAPPSPADADERPWIMLYTSGTTGRPKGCLLSQRGQMISLLAMMGQWGLQPGEGLLLSLPLFHVGGTGVLFAALASGARILVAPRQFGAEQAYRLIADEACVAAAIVPQYYEGLIACHRREQAPLALRIASAGGGMHDPAFIEEIRTALGTELLLGYGQTEAGNYIAYLRGEEQLRAPKACGRLLPHLDMRVAGEGDAPLPPGETGELLVRGPGIFERYWQADEASEATLRGGWLHTGDLMRLDGDGLLTLVGRAKELIKTGGENVYPREVEAVLLEHPDIVDCAVFGVAHDYWGESVKAMVALRPGAALRPADVASWCRQHIAAYKRPRFVEFVAAMPRTDTGKLVTRDLRARPVTADQATD